MGNACVLAGRRNRLDAPLTDEAPHFQGLLALRGQRRTGFLDRSNAERLGGGRLRSVELPGQALSEFFSSAWASLMRSFTRRMKSCW